jgi:peroxiredoxin
MIAIGEKAPVFNMAGTGGPVDVGALLRQGPVVLYFFPKAFTPG